MEPVPDPPYSELRAPYVALNLAPTALGPKHQSIRAITRIESRWGLVALHEKFDS
jgi:hypothetical protein